MLPADVPPLRADPYSEDAGDGKRLELVKHVWHSQDQALRLRDRQIEENIRMLAGQQWVVYNPLVGRFIDVTQWMTSEERRWRQRPVINQLLQWFILTHARLTENPPIVTFLPGPDKKDSDLAETMDTVYKALWRDVGMQDTHDRLMAWLIPGGEAYLMSRIDFSRGPLQKWIADADVPMHHFDGRPMMDETGQPMSMRLQGVPLDSDGTPKMIITPDGPQPVGDGAPHVEREGAMVAEVMSPLQVRGQWGAHVPWHLKKWHATQTYLTVEEIFEATGQDVKPEQPGSFIEGTGELQRLLFGSGYYGSAAQSAGSGGGSPHLGAESGSPTQTEGYCKVTTYWRAPCDYGGMQETDASPGGRLMVCTDTRVLIDGPRPARFPYTSPIRRFEFVRLPGRPSGSTPQEAMNPIQRAYNKGWAQILEHRNLSSNPIGIIDGSSGIKDGQLTNQPGQHVTVMRRQGVPALEFVSPPPLGQDVYRSQELLLEVLMVMGNVHGATGQAPTSDPSGELLKELRFNSDRFLGPTARRNVEEYARLVQDWMVLVPKMWDEAKIISYAGEDNVARTITVYPDLFLQGNVNVVPDIESMLPEGRGERQDRVRQMYQDGLFGLPGTPEARNLFFEMGRFPHLGRAGKVGGIDRIAADQENGRLMQGESAQTIPIFEWYNDDIHLMSHEGVMKSPEFLKLPPPVQAQFALHWNAHKLRQTARAMAQMQTAAAMSGGGAPPPGGGSGRPSKAKGGGGAFGSSAQPPTASPPPGMAPDAMPLGVGG